MKTEQLLDAMGSIDEAMLLQSEQTVKTGRVPIRRMVLIAAAVGLLAISVAAATGLFSVPIGKTKVDDGAVIAPFEMDAQGNIVPGDVRGVQITMEVDAAADAPDYLEKIYHLELSDAWEWSGGNSAGGIYTYFARETHWKQEGRPGEVRLSQSVIEEGKTTQVVDQLHKLPQNTPLSTCKTKMAGLEVLKLTIPELPDYDGTNYCSGGETRIYWSDGHYLLRMDYPYWMSDAQAEALLLTLNTEEFVLALPEDFGTVNTQRLMELKPSFSIEKGKTGTTMANNVMSLGRFAYSDGAVYYAADCKIFRYDLETKQVKTYYPPCSAMRASVNNLFATENYICYNDMLDTLMAVPKDGSEAVAIYQGLGVTQLYADGNVLYTNNHAEYLSSIDLVTGKVENLVNDVNSYYVDDTYIYVVQAIDDGEHFLRSRKDKVDFEKIPLSFYPIKVLANGEDLYFCEGGKSLARQLIHYRDGVETRLPVYAYDYQIFDGKLIYNDINDSWVVKSYDLQTGETEVLQERAADFSILEERYICFECVDSENHPYPLILDTHTGTYHRPDITD